MRDIKIPEYGMRPVKYAKTVGRIGNQYFEIEKVAKETKYVNSTGPMIVLFCKSSGKCAV